MSVVGAARTLEAALFGTEDAAAADDSHSDSSTECDASLASPTSAPGNESFESGSFRSTVAPPPPPPPPPRRPTADYTGVRSTASSSGTSPTTVEAAASDLFSLVSARPPAAAAAAEGTAAAQSRSEKHAARHAAAALRSRKKATGASSKRKSKLLPQPRQTHFAPGYVGVTWPRGEPQALLDEQEHREWVSSNRHT
jgi:hypothetical protein